MDAYRSICIGIIVGLALGWFLTNEAWKKSSVATGAAIYYLDPDGITRWRWNNPPPTIYYPNLSITTI
jgi:hypothetical protein